MFCEGPTVCVFVVRVPQLLRYMWSWSLTVSRKCSTYWRKAKHWCSMNSKRQNKTGQAVVHMSWVFSSPFFHLQTSFADFSPLLLASESSMELLNSKLEQPLPMERFRPNIILSGCLPHSEVGPSLAKNWNMFRYPLSFSPLPSHILIPWVFHSHTPRLIPRLLVSFPDCPRLIPRVP